MWSDPEPSRPRLRRRRLRFVLAAVGVLLAGVRLALPYALTTAINRRLDHIPDYSGRVESVGVSLLRGAYTMQGLRIDKREGDTTHPFATADRLDFSLAWKELLRGRVVSEIVTLRPRINVVRAATKQGSHLDFDRRWQEVIDDLFPIEITHFEATEGEIHFVAPEREPPVDIFLRELHVRARGLRNRRAPDTAGYPAVILAEGRTPGNGTLSLVTNLEPLADQPHFHARLKIDRLSLPSVNQLLLAYANVDVSAGEFTGYLEMVARDGRFSGYLKPFFENLEFDSPRDSERSVFARLWEKLVAFTAGVMKNDDTEQVAMRVPFSGEFGDTSVGQWESVRTMLRNAFIRALAEGLDGHPRPKGDASPMPASDPPRDES